MGKSKSLLSPFPSHISIEQGKIKMKVLTTACYLAFLLVPSSANLEDSAHDIVDRMEEQVPSEAVDLPRDLEEEFGYLEGEEDLEYLEGEEEVDELIRDLEEEQNLSNLQEGESRDLGGFWGGYYGYGGPGGWYGYGKGGKKGGWYGYGGWGGKGYGGKGFYGGWGGKGFYAWNSRYWGNKGKGQQYRRGNGRDRRRNGRNDRLMRRRRRRNRNN